MRLTDNMRSFLLDRIRLVNELIAGGPRVEYADFVLILTAVLSACSARRWPGRGIDRNRFVELLVMIGRHFGDQIRGMPRPDDSLSDFDLRRHAQSIRRTERTSSNASAAAHPTTLPHRVAIARSASGDRGCGNLRASDS